MRTKPFLFIVVMVTASLASAQKAKPSFHPSFAVGLIEGEQGGALQLQTVQSVGYKSWTAGLGAGFDFYHTRSVPLFLALQKAVGKKEERPFVYLNGGYNIPWLTAADKTFIVESKGGLYYDAGIGYEFPVMKKNRFFFSAGISGKELNITQEPFFIIDVYPSPPPPFLYQHYHYRLQRISVKAGLIF